MQTFLPYPDFAESARVLDRQRLGKQRVEAKQILMCLLGEGSLHWKHHPAVRMWRGYEPALARYGYEVCYEWRARGYKDQQLEWFLIKYNEMLAAFSWGCPLYDPFEDPWWLGNHELHASHRACLLAKDYEHYRQFGWSEQPARVSGKGEQWPYKWVRGRDARP